MSDCDAREKAEREASPTAFRELEYRWAEGHNDLLASMAADLVRHEFGRMEI